jgi:hexokinase
MRDKNIDFKYKFILNLGLSVIINRINKPNVTVGVDGSLYRYHPRFKRNMEKCMKTLVNKNIKVCLIVLFHF